ncbi:MAG: 2-hydroxyacyl-CoA dehydratase [Bacilli bacterium]
MKAHQLYKQLTEDYYSQAEEAKKEGKLVGWASSNFPCEIPESLSLCIQYPENHAAMLSSKKAADKYFALAEQKGYSNDLCSYARINLGYCETFDSEQRNLVRPDFLLCSSNTCHQLIKWYEILSLKFEIPLFILDIPYQMKGTPDQNKLDYVKNQLDVIIKELSFISHQTFNQSKLDEVMEICKENARLWHSILDLAKNKPSPINGFDLFVYMSAIVTMRSKKETTVFLKKLKEEIENKVENKKTTYPGKEEYRVSFEGICCWPCLYEFQIPLINNHINVVGGKYLDLFALTYSDYPSLIQAYCSIPNSLGIENAIKESREIVSEYQTDGVIFNLTRSCRIWCGYYFALEREIRNGCNQETLLIDSDQADRRNFAFAQYETRVEAFSEMLSEKEQ